MNRVIDDDTKAAYSILLFLHYGGYENGLINPEFMRILLDDLRGDDAQTPTPHLDLMLESNYLAAKSKLKNISFTFDTSGAKP